MMNEITSAYNELVESVSPFNCRLIAVSKRQPLDRVRALYAAGHRDFGENRVQEMTEKMEILPNDIKWHMIGHLQTNKVKYIIGKVEMIHSVDRLKLARKINSESTDLEIITPVLLQIKIADEASKFGYNFEELSGHLSDGKFRDFANINVCGVMGMATFTDDLDQVRKEFKTLKNYFDILKSTHFKNDEKFRHISMGMSGDYKIALEEGSTMIRVGSKIFGPREY